MPELPEMETYKNLLTKLLHGKTIRTVTINREKSINTPIELFTSEVANRTIIKIERRAKYLIFHLSSGKKLLLHLMLGGWLYYGTQEDSPSRTKQVIFTIDQHQLYFIGLRLGYLHLVNEDQLNDLFHHGKPFSARIVNVNYIFYRVGVIHVFR